VKDPVKEWLPVRVTQTGVLASGIRRPNGKLAAQCADASCPPAVMENLLRQLDGARVLFATEKNVPRWVTYSFEHGQIRYACRVDGWQLAIVVRPETEAAQNLDILCEEFLGLKIGK
jgi:hypothetical protein